MNKSVSLTLRIFGIALAIAACVFAYLLNGKVETAMKHTEWAVTDPEILAHKNYEGRMNDLGKKVKELVEAKRAKIGEMEKTVADLQTDVTDKKSKIEGLTANVSSLEAERSELTLKRDSLAALLTEATTKSDSLATELNGTKQSLAKEKEKAASLFTKEQIDAEIAKTAKAEEGRKDLAQKYNQLYSYAQTAGGNTPPFPRDPATEGGAETAKADFGPESIKTRIILLNSADGLVCFSVGELNGIKAQSTFKVRLGDKEIGRVHVESVQNAICTAQILTGSSIDDFSNGDVVTLETEVGKVANN
jgi:peptidoglycan hydrolase CwlO-like protein